MINSFIIHGFRGIRDLSVHNLKLINLIVGDNNSGKTSILEALQLLRNPEDVSNLYKVARSRDNFFISSGVSLYENVICLFPQFNDYLSLGVSAKYNDKMVKCIIKGKQERIMIDSFEINKSEIRDIEMIGETEADQFKGDISFDNGRQSGTRLVQLNTYSKASGATINKNFAIRMAYVSQCDHLRGHIINQIIRNDSYKEICIKALQLFDPDIVDIFVLKSPVSIRAVDYIKHKTLGTMPLSTFGDGIKKVLVLANAIAQATDGILFIDEIETAIHKKYYDDIFRFIVKACSAFNVQVFITTHSIEAVDGLLSTQNYDEQSEVDDISVITLKRVNCKNYSRVLSGREVAKDREAFGFEVRI